MAKTKKMPPLPKTLFIRREPDGDNDSFLMEYETIEAATTEDGEPTEVGTYVLQSTRRLRRVVTVKEE